jgi:hypothetical protein
MGSAPGKELGNMSLLSYSPFKLYCPEMRTVLRRCRDRGGDWSRAGRENRARTTSASYSLGSGARRPSGVTFLRSV